MVNTSWFFWSCTEVNIFAALIIVVVCFILRALKLGEYVNKQLNKQGIIRLWLIQTSLVLLLSLVWMLIDNARAGYSAFLGGAVCIIPNALFAVRLFKHQGARLARQIVRNFYRGEALKIVLSVLLFSLVFALCNIAPMVFFTTYVVVLMTHWFTPLIMVNKRK